MKDIKSSPSGILTRREVIVKDSCSKSEASAGEPQTSFVFNHREWWSPNSYCNDYDVPPSRPGVYLLGRLLPAKRPKDMVYEILYVGSSKSLHKRLKRHPVKRLLEVHYGNVVSIHFQERDNYREREKELIKLIQPLYNKQWR
jgi:hypothetical protein